MSKRLRGVRLTACALACIGLAACGGSTETGSSDNFTKPDTLVTSGALNQTTKIVNGTDVTDLRYPWMAAVYFRRLGNSFSQGCGGSLISDRWVVSAAHCFTGSGGRSPADVALVHGTPDLNATSEGIVSRISRIIIHPQYNPGANRNDIALLELTEPVFLQPITLSRATNPVPNDGEIATVAGWGATSESGPGSTLLQETDLPIVSTNACQSLYGNLINGPAHLCAGGQLTDSCFGDSGGPLFVARGNEFVQAGVVSFGFGCARPGLPAVYTRTSTYFDWISSIVPGLQAFGENNVEQTPKTQEVLVQIRKSNAQGFAIESNNGGAPRQNVYLWTANAGDVNQQWIETDRGNGLYSYRKNGTNFCIDGDNGGANRQNVYLWSCDTTNQNQLWRKAPAGNGTFRLIKSNATGFALDGGNGGARNQNVKIFDSSNPSQNLNWIITPL